MRKIFFVDPSRNGDRKQKERERERESFLPYMQTQKFHLEINNYYHIHIMSKRLGNLFLGLLEKTKYQIIRFISGTSYGEDRQGVTFTTSNISLHLLVTCSRLKDVLKAHSQVWDNFWQINALWKWWKMLLFLPLKLFSFSRYSSLSLDFLAMYKNGLIKKIRLISKFMTSQPG